MVPLASVGPPFAPIAGVEVPPGAGVPLPSGAGEPAIDDRGVVSRSFRRLSRLKGCWRLEVSAVMLSFPPFSPTPELSPLSVGDGPIDW